MLKLSPVRPASGEMEFVSLTILFNVLFLSESDQPNQMLCCSLRYLQLVQMQSILDVFFTGHRLSTSGWKKYRPRTALPRMLFAESSALGALQTLTAHVMLAR